VKPLREDASLGIENDALIQTQKDLQKQVQKIHRIYRQPALIEEYIDGRELNISIIGNEKPLILPISEIDFSTLPAGLPKICGYAAKWQEKSPEFAHTIPQCPAKLSSALRKKIKEISLHTYQILECRDYARVDIRLDAKGSPFVLEINANPDISPDAGMTRSAKIAGFSYPEFIGQIVEHALSRSVYSPISRRHRKVSIKSEAYV
jgi:D-alanine-D-alanine ligase